MSPTLRDEIGAEDYARFEKAIKDYCVAATMDENEILCPKRALRQRWIRERLRQRGDPFVKDPVP